MKKVSLILHYLQDYKGKIVLYFFTSLMAVLFGLFSFAMLQPVLETLFMNGQAMMPVGNGLAAQVSRYVTRFILRHSREEALTYSVLIVVGFTLLKNLSVYLSFRILNPIRYNVMRRLRDELFVKTLSLPIGFFTEERKSDLISRMTNDLNEVEVSIMNVLETFIREPLTITFVFGYMIFLSPQLTLFLLIFLPLAGLLIGRVGKSLKKPSGLAQEQLGHMLGVMDETLVGMRVVKAFNAETHQKDKFIGLNNTWYRIRNKLASRKDLASPLSETLGVLVVGIILWYGGRLIFSGNATLTGASFVVFISFFYQIINPVKNLSSAIYNIQKGAAAVERIEFILNADNNITEKQDAVALPAFNHTIELRDVHFAYGDKKILNGVNITIQKGKTVALVGASGAGKSTLVDLIPRFHDVTSGEILIDGINVKDCKLYDLRKQMGIVSQEPILFNDTIANNITLGTDGATQAQVEEAARIAHAHNFITGKPEGYHTSVGDRGTKLSGGERQRVTIARAVLKNPPILILDEATSSLDTESERIVQDAINTLMKNRTCIVIAHRLSTVQHADEIIVLEKGSIAERGTHNDLITKNGLYKKLVEMQQVK